jgi:hypothetical protein
MAIDTGEPEFNYAVTDACGAKSIPLELKILMVLRTLGSGLIFNASAELTVFYVV